VLLTDLTALEQIIQSTYTVPAIPIGFEEHVVFASVVGPAVLVRQKIDEELAALAFYTTGKRDLARLRVEVVHE